MDQCTYRVITESDTDSVRYLLEEQFHYDQPLYKCFQNPVRPDIIETVISWLPLGYSTLAEDAEGNVAGMMLGNPLSHAETNEELRKADPMGAFFMQLSEQTKPLIEHFKFDKCMEGVILSVDRRFRGQGIGQKLYSENMKLAKSFGFSGYISDCTSCYSAKLCEKLGMTMYYEMKYTDYRDLDGKPIIQPDAPHYSVKCYVKRL